MKRRTTILAALAATAVIGGVVWLLQPRPLEVELARAETGPFEQTIDEDARTRLADRYVVSAPLAGRLARITLREGDAVEAGAVVATLQPVLSPLLDERSRLEQASRVEVAQANLQRAATRIEAARVALRRAEDDVQRSEQLAQQGFVAPTKIESDRLAVQAAQKELQTAVDGRHIAEHELAQARAAFGLLRAPVAGSVGAGGFAVRAPVAGRVLKVHHLSETTVALGAPLLEIGDLSHLEIVAELLTADALQARPGSVVRIERWGGPGTLTGQVRRVEPAGFTKVSALGVEEQRVNVLIELTSPREQWAALGDGFRVGVRIVTRSEPRVLRVPVGAVFPQVAGRANGNGGGNGGSAVFVVDGGRARLQPVEVAARNGAQAWIRSGLAEGSSVIVYPAPGVADGVRVVGRDG